MVWHAVGGHVLAFAISLALGLYLTPLMRRGALLLGVVDRPDSQLKRHKTSTPYLGGVAVYLAFIISLSLLTRPDPRTLSLLLGGTMVAMVGLLDDLRVLPPQFKLTGQLIAVWVAMRAGVCIEIVALPTAMAFPLTALWLVGVTNAFNLIDVSDGVMGAVVVPASLGLAVVALLNGDHDAATLALAIAGAMAGFLWYNKPPASIFCGDTGALFVGFLLAALAIRGSYSGRNVLAPLTPLWFFFVPLMEGVLLTIARLRRGMPPWQGSDDHVAHRLSRHGWCDTTVAWLAFWVTCAGVAAGLGLVFASPTTALALVIGLMVVAAATAALVLRFTSQGTRRGYNLPKQQTSSISLMN